MRPGECAAAVPDATGSDSCLWSNQGSEISSDTTTPAAPNLTAGGPPGYGGPTDTRSVFFRKVLKNVLVKILKVSFELVNPIGNSQFYCGCGEHPASDPATIPDEHWSTAERAGEPTTEGRQSVLDQYRNLLQQIREGELIRNVRLWETEEPVWTEVALIDLL